MGAELHSTGQNRYMTTGKTGTAGSDYSVTQAARTSAADLATAAGLTGMLDLGSKIGERFRGVIIGFMASAASSAVPFRIYAKRRGVASGGATTEDYCLSLLLTGSFTSSAAGVGTSATAIVKATEYVADIITFTIATGGVSPSGPGATINSALGSAGAYAYSPGTAAVQINLSAELWIPDVGNAEGLIIDFDPGNTVVANAIWEGVV